MLLPPPTPFFPPLSPLPPLPLSGCVYCGRRSGSSAAPTLIRDGPDGRTTKTRYGTASAAAPVAAEVTEEEECNGCDSADPRCRLDDSLLRLSGQDPPPLDHCNNGAAVAESGDHNDVDACD